MIKRISRITRFMLYLLAWLLLLAIIANVWVLVSTQGFVYKSPTTFPEQRDALVLGTSPTTQDGRPNAFFLSRIRSAAELYKAGKAPRIIVSGHRELPGYDEPGEMKDKLIEAGVPAEAIVIDEAGFRTLDSVIRARDLLNTEKLTIISDPFHVNRALFIAQHSGVDSIAFAPASLVEPPTWLKVREFLARIAAIFDIFILKTQPKVRD